MEFLQVSSLTTNLNTVTGGAGDDTISGGTGTIDSDSITGGEGSDTLSVTLSNADDNNAAFTMSGVETFQARTTGAVTLDMGSVSGVETYVANRLAGNLTLNDVQDIANIQIDRNTGNADIDVNYEATVSSGASDSITITVDNSSDVGTVNVDGVETVNLVSNNNPLNDTNEIQIDAAGTGTATEVLNISGAGDLTVAATDALTINNSASGDVALTPTAATAINHSGSGSLTFTVAAQDVAITGSGTGALVVTANGANDLTIVGGSGNDDIDMLATLETDDSIDGGEGTDTLTVSGDGVTSAEDGDITVVNVENLEIESVGADNLDFDVFSDASTFDRVIVTSTANADSVTLTDVQSSAYTIRNASTGNAADDLAAVTIDLKTSTGSDTAISVDLANRQTGVGANTEAFTLGTLTAAGVETLTINTSKVSSTGTAEDITITTLTTAALSTLNINGNADFVVTNALSTTTDVIDASGSTGVVSLTVAGSDVAYTGGTGADTIAFGTSLDGDDSVDGGDGTDTVTATFNAGTVTPANITNVETFSATFGGGALNASGLTGLDKITIASATAAAVISQIGANVTTINQRGDGTTLNINYANGADATVAYNTAGAGAVAIANAATSFSNVASLTLSSDNGADTNSTVDLGALNGGTALTSLTVNSSSDADDTIDTGNVTAANLETLTIVADEASLTVGTLSAAGNVTTLSISNLDAESDGNITVGAIGAGTAADALTSVSVVANGNALTGSTVMDLDDIDAAGADIGSFTVNLGGNYGASDIGTVTADNITALSVTTTSAGTSFTITDMDIAETVGSMTFATGDDFVFTNALAIGTSVGDITITATDSFDGNADGIFIDEATTVGDITITASGSGNGVNLGELDNATTVGNITITANDDVEFDGADAATSIGNITASVASGKTVDLNDGTFGAATGIVGTITVTGAGAFTLAVGAVTTLGNIDLTGMTSTSSSNIALSNTTAIGVVYSGGAGADTFAGTGGADVITAGEGIDVIDSQGGADTISLTETTAAVDTVSFTVPGALNATANADVISGFATTSDKLSFDGITITGGGAIAAVAGTAAPTDAGGGEGANAAAALTDNTIYVVDNGAQPILDGGAESVADYTDLTDVAAYLDEAYNSTADDDAAIFIINDLAGDKAYIYLFDEQTGGASTIQAADLALIGIVNTTSALVAGDVA